MTRCAFSTSLRASMVAAILAMLLTVLCAPGGAHAQRRNLDSTLAEWTKAGESAPRYVGLYGSIGLPLSMGEVSLGCKCVFSSETGITGGGGLLVTFELDDRWSFETRFGFDRSRVDYKTVLTLSTFVKHGSRVGIDTLDVENHLVLDISAFAASVALRWRSCIGELYFVAGPQLGYLYKVNAKWTSEIVGRNDSLVFQESGTKDLVSYDGPIEKKLDFRSIQLGLLAGAGYDISLGESLKIAPELAAVIPITGMSSDYKSWKIASLNAMVLLLLRL